MPDTTTEARQTPLKGKIAARHQDWTEYKNPQGLDSSYMKLILSDGSDHVTMVTAFVFDKTKDRQLTEGKSIMVTN